MVNLITVVGAGNVGATTAQRVAEKELARDALNRVGMGDFAGRQIGQLSGGQQQRSFLARALRCPGYGCRRC